MASEIGVLIVHGMGAQPADFADAFIAEMQGRLLRLGVNPDRVAWRAGWWADTVKQREDELWNELTATHTLRYDSARRFIISSFGDALAYQREPSQATDVYRTIHARIREHLAALREEMGGDKPIVVLAHSLGSVIISNYTWDEQKAPTPGTTATQRMETLAGLVTFGSNIPLFTLCLDDVVAIRFPVPAVSGAIRDASRWLNFFDADDVLGYPLRPLSPSYRDAVSADLQINVGSILRSWNPLSHDEYWTDNDFTGPVASLIREVLEASGQ
ncbi:MAG: alpha/beta fold hydrolase [Gemmatimonadaceae bacterium]